MPAPVNSQTDYQGTENQDFSQSENHSQSYDSSNASQDYNGQNTEFNTQDNQLSSQENGQSQEQGSNSENDVFGEYYNFQNQNLADSLYQDPYQQQNHQQFQQPQPQMQPQMQYQQPQQQMQQPELFDDFSKVIEHAGTLENIDLGISDEELVDMLDKNPRDFANTIAKTAITQALQMVGKLDFDSVIEKNSYNNFAKYAEQQQNAQRGNEFIQSTRQELAKNNIYMNDQQAELVFTRLAQTLPNEYQQYVQYFNQASIMGNLQNAKLPHNNGQLLTQQEFAKKSVMEMAKAISRGQQNNNRQFKKVTTNQIHSNTNTSSMSNVNVQNMTDEQFIEYKKSLGY